MNFIRIIFLISATNALQCMDENNNPVDWYVQERISHIKHVSHSFISGLLFINTQL